MRGKKWYARRWLQIISWSLPRGDPSEDPHETTIFNGSILVDKGIFALVTSLNASGITTYNSCEGDTYLDSYWREKTPNLRSPYSAYITVGSFLHADVLGASITQYAKNTGETGGIEIHFIGAEDPSAQKYFHVSFPALFLREENFVSNVLAEISRTSLADIAA